MHSLARALVHHRTELRAGAMPYMHANVELWLSLSHSSHSQMMTISNDCPKHNHLIGLNPLELSMKFTSLTWIAQHGPAVDLDVIADGTAGPPHMLLGSGASHD